MSEFFFDSHLHATLKKQFANPSEPIETGALPMFSPWKTAVRDDFLEGFAELSLARCFLQPFVENTLVSQSSLRQLTDSQYKLAMIALFHPDRGLIQLIKGNPQFFKIVTNRKFGNLLLDTQFTKIAEAVNAFDTLLEDLRLLNLPDSPGTIRKGAHAPFEPTQDDPLSVVFSIEGLHCLRSNLNETDPQRIIADILKNLKVLLDSGNPVIAINLAHIDGENSLFANQAYAVDGFREGGFKEERLRPTGNGLTPAGEQIARKLYDAQILPDVKHMSWVARRDFYAFRERETIQEPIVCSHAAFTGCWFNKHGESIRDYTLASFTQKTKDGHRHRQLRFAKPNPYLGDGRIGFNMSTINLFNEDIEAILASDGLIGISLDQRILGFTDFKDDPGSGIPPSANVIIRQQFENEFRFVTDSDFISEDEAAREPLFTQEVKAITKKLQRCVQTVSRQHRLDSDTVKQFHRRHFYLQLVHAIQVARQVAGEAGASKMLSQVLCIGSDFDGLIDGVNCCQDVTHISRFKAEFLQEFDDFLRETSVSLPAGMDVKHVADRLFYENGRDFVLNRLEKIRNAPPIPDAPLA